MQQDMHYYAVYHLSRLAGFKRQEAGVIAYASQYVDDSTESEPILVNGDQVFDTVRTAHIGLEAYDWDVQKKVYMPFHFLPHRVRRKHSRRFRYLTQEATGAEGDLATLLFHEALTETDEPYRLVRLGVALHPLVDSFSHQGFSGRHHNENKVGKIWHRGPDSRWSLRLLDAYVDLFLPSIGHARALQNPDVAHLTWRYEDYRDHKIVRVNRDIALRACQLMYRFLRNSLGDWSPRPLAEAESEEFRHLQALLSWAGSSDSRHEAWRQHTRAPRYSSTRWRRQALLGNVVWDDMSRSERRHRLESLRGKADFDNSNWARFHRAARRQRALVLDWLN